MAGEDQPQRDEGFVGRTQPDGLQRTVERRRGGRGGALGQHRVQSRRLGNRVAEKIAVDDFEAHHMRFATAALCCFIATFAPAHADDSRAKLDALLARVRSAAGQPYRLHLRGTAVTGSGAGQVTVVSESEGARSSVRRCTGRLCSGTYADGAALWVTDLNDTAVPAEPDDPRRVTLRAIENDAFAGDDFETHGGRLTLRVPLRMHDGRTLQRIAVTAPHGATLDALIDPESGLVAEARGAGVAVIFSDQRTVGTLTVPFEITTGSNVERFTERSVDPEPLRAPPGLVPKFAAGDSKPIPFVDVERPSVEPVVECEMGKQRVPCLFDTGNSGMSMSLELAERLGLEPLADTFRVEGLGSYETGVVNAPELRVGRATYPPAFYAVLHDLHGYGYDLVLGADAFAHARITIDYPRRLLALEPESAPAAEASSLPLSFENFLPVTPVALGTVKASLAIDTGDESAVDLSAEYYRLHPGLFKADTRARVAGIGGTSEELLGTIERVDLGAYALLHQPIGATAQVASTAEGRLGSGALAHFAVTFDYARRRVELSPRPGDPAVVSSSAARP